MHFCLPRQRCVFLTKCSASGTWSMLRKWSALRAWSVPSARYAEHLTSLCVLGAILHLGDSPNFTAAQPQHNYWNICKHVYNIGESEVHIMSDSKLRTQSMDFAVQIINLVKSLKEKRESIISNQIGRSGRIGCAGGIHYRYASGYAIRRNEHTRHCNKRNRCSLRPGAEALRGETAA